MSRLYIEKNTIKNEQTRTFAKEGESSTPQKGGLTDYLEKVTKLIPSEIIAAFIAMVGILEGTVTPPSKGPGDVEVDYRYWIVFWFCLVMTPIYLYVLSEKDKPKYYHIALSVFAFTIWAFVTKGATYFGDEFDPTNASLLLIAFTIVSGLFPLKK